LVRGESNSGIVRENKVAGRIYYYLAKGTSAFEDRGRKGEGKKDDQVSKKKKEQQRLYLLVKELGKKRPPRAR